jgi:hypothetical protein
MNQCGSIVGEFEDGFIILEADGGEIGGHPEPLYILCTPYPPTYLLIFGC